jgi:hypothetical protein
VEVEKDMVEVLKLKKKMLGSTSLSLTMKHVSDVGDVVLLDMPAVDVADILDDLPVRNM